MFNEYLYLILMIISLLICIYAMSTLKTKKKQIVMARPFRSHFANELYALSFEQPFKTFINDDLSHPKVTEINKLLAKAGLSGVCDYRVFTVIQTFVMLTCFIIGFLFVIFLKEMAMLVKFLFNVELYSADANPQQTSLMIFLVVMSVSLAPKMYLKSRTKKNQFGFLRDLPVLQLFIIQMLQSNQPVSKVLYFMSEIKTRYKDIFAVSYRMFTRSPEDGIRYLSGAFDETKFNETVTVLGDYNNYAKKESIKIMNNISKDIESELTTVQKNQSTTGMLLSQGALIIPFMSIIFLGIIPIVVFATTMMAEAQNI